MIRLRIRLSLRSHLVLVGVLALGCWGWVTFLSPSHRWQRTILADMDSARRWEAATQGIRGKAQGVDRAQAIAALGRALHNPSRRVRETAATVLRWAGPDARPVVPDLIAAMKDPIPTVRWRAADSLGPIVGRDEATRAVAAPALISLLNDRHPDTRMAAAFSLALMGRGEPAIPVMLAGLDADRSLASTAALGLGLCGSRDPRAIQALETARGSFDPLIRELVVDALDRVAETSHRPDAP